jgi:hypothetical protein
MELLKLNAKLFRIEDGETHYILAVNEQQAREFYMSLMDADIKKSLLEDNQTSDINECYDIMEIQEDTEDQIPIHEEDIIRNIANVESLNSYTYAMYIVLERFMQYEKIELPLIVASSAY